MRLNYNLGLNKYDYVCVNRIIHVCLLVKSGHLWTDTRD